MRSGIFLCVFLISTLLNAQENIQWRGTDRTGIYKEQGLLTSWPTDGPDLLWHYEGLGEGHSSVAIDGDKIYLTGLKGDNGVLYVFDFNGKLLQQKEYGPEWTESYPGPRGTATINNGKVYIISGMGALYCMDQNTLDIIWKKNVLEDYNASNIRWGINEAPLVMDNMVIATPGGNQNNMVAFDKNTGNLLWTSKGEGDKAAYCSPLYIKDQEVPQIVTITANHVIGIEAKTGKKLWSYEKTNQYAVHANTPVYGNNMILCTSGYGGGSSMLKLTNGGRNVEKVWNSEQLDNRIGAMVKIGNYAYGSGDKNRFWFCVDWFSGEIKYQQSGFAMGNIIADNNMLYCYTDRGEMFLVKAIPEKFDVVSRFKIPFGTAQHWAHPVIYNGVLYVRHGDSLMAYKIK